MFNDFVRPGTIKTASAFLIYNETQIGERLNRGLKPSDVHREILDWLQSSGSDFQFSYETMRRFVKNRNLRSQQSAELSPLQTLRNKAEEQKSGNYPEKPKIFDPTGHVDQKDLI